MKRKLKINKEKYLGLKDSTQKAEEKKKDSFLFQGAGILTSNAKYLVHFLEGIYEPEIKQP